MLRLTLRNLLARKVRLVMSGLSVILGVAFLSGVLVFSNGLSSTFDAIITGSTPDGVVRPVGSAEFDGGFSGQSDLTLQPDVVERLATLPEVARADGDVDGFGMSLLGKDGTVVGGTGAPTLAFNRTDAPTMDGRQALTLTSGRWPSDAGLAADGSAEIVLDDAAAKAGGYRVGDEVKLVAPFGQLQRTARLVGTAEFTAGGTAGATLLVFSTRAAQQIFLGGADAFTRISLTAAPGVSQAALVRAADRVLPENYEAATGDTVAQESQDAIGTFLGVINTFLLVFAIIAVLVGGFIIVNTFSILVAQRTRELALLRALGAARGQVTRSVLVEALAMALVATTAGVGIGWLLARGLAAVFRTFGLDISSDALDLTAPALIASYAVGVGVTMAAAYLPARRGAKVPPVAAMRTDSAPERPLGRRTLIGAIVIAVGAGLVITGLSGAPGSDAAWVGTGAVLWILALIGTSSVLGRPVLIACRALFSRLLGTPGRLAAENALRDPRRTGATASALMIGLALVSTIGVLAASLNSSIDDLVDEQFTADLLVRDSTFLPFSTNVGDAIEKVPGIATLSRQQRVDAQVDGPDGAPRPGTVDVGGVSGTYSRIYRPEVVSGTARFTGREAVLAQGEARSLGLGVGDPLRLSFPGGKRLDLTVVGVVKDAESLPDVLVPLERLTDAGLRRQDTSISILVAPGSDVATVQKAVDDAASVVPTVGVFDKVSFAEDLRGQVNQLLYLIYALLALAIVIAVIGIINTLGLSVIERTREIGLLRAIGMSRAALRRMITLESIAIAVLGAVLGLGLGVLVGVLLQRSLQADLTSLGVPLGQLALFLVLSVVVGVVAAVVPAIRAARLDVLRAIATE